MSGIHFEHAWGDGVAVLRFFNEIYKDSTENPTCSTAQLAALDLSASTYRKLELTIPSSVESKIKTAKDKFDQRVNSLDMDTLQLFTFGREYLKRTKISPDAIMQLAFQVRNFKYGVLFRPQRLRALHWEKVYGTTENELLENRNNKKIHL